MEKSTHKVEVVEVRLLPHPNADSLSIVKVWDYTCVVKTSDWHDGDLAAYIPPDSVVPATEQFAFLDGHYRIKARKMRGIWSQGLLMPAPEGSKLGDDVAELMGITHWEPPLEVMGTNGIDAKAPENFRDLSVYDIDTGFRYNKDFVEGEEVVATCKLDGANFAIVFSTCDNELHVRSRKLWKDKEGKDIWWTAVEQNSWVAEWCKEHPDIVVYGEVFGWVQKNRYGAKQGQYFIRVFDLYRDGRFVDNDEARELGKDLLWVPVVYRGPFDLEKLKQLASGKSLFEPSCDREGIVVKPAKERYSRELNGRLQVKFVSAEYLAKSKEG